LPRCSPGWRSTAKTFANLERADGAPAEPSSFSSAVPNWAPGDTIPLGRRTLRVVGVRDDDADSPPVLVVEDVA
jgi:hypothetical protein